jgi:CheY-like chemotaxis protein/nitrogen-specific signal transduction histidine kinase
LADLADGAVLLVNVPDAAPGGLTRTKPARRLHLRAERLSALESMARAISHDLNNDLAVISGVADILLGETRDLLTAEQVLGRVQLIRDASADAARIIARLRAFYRPRDDPKVVGPVDLARVVLSAIAECHLSPEPVDGTTDSIEVALDLAPIPPIRGNLQDLRRALIELLSNAIEATGVHGKIDVRLRVVGTEICLTVQDNGVGMAKDLVERCHEPFVTTQVGSGRGLGLSIVYGTLRRHDGRLDVRSRPGRGTTVTAFLPAAFGSSSADSGQLASKPERSLRVLLVDDNRSLLTVVEAMLRSDDHVVDVARDGNEALAIYRASKYDVVLTDQSMPHLTGLQLAAAIKAAAPRQPVIMMTGYDPEDAAEGAGRAVDVIVRKPMTLATLQRALADAVASR